MKGKRGQEESSRARGRGEGFARMRAFMIQSFSLFVEAYAEDGESMMRLLVQMSSFCVLGEAFRYETAM